MNLPLLLTRFRQLQQSGRGVRAKAMRGLEFERLLSDLFRQQGILMTEPFRIAGEQVDGAFEYKGWTYLVEAKWQDARKSTDALYFFQGKADRRIEGTRGLFISISGYHDTSVRRFAEGKRPNTILWSGTHIEALLEGTLTLPDLIDASIRYAAERSQLLVPIKTVVAERADELLAAALEASTAQVDAEIAAAVGRKFIPKLYVERHVEQDIARLLHPEREIDSVLAEFASNGVDLRRECLNSQETEPRDPLATLGLILNSVRSQHCGSTLPSGVLRLFLDTLPVDPLGRMHVITSRAGMGKTNLLCHLAKSHAKRQPTVFLTGRSGISAGTSITSLIEAKLTRYLRPPLRPGDWLQQFVSIARAKGTSVLVIIDAINEHRDLDVINGAMSHLLYEVVGLPVVILASCRDVYWPFFDTSLWPNKQWRTFDRRLDLFSARESNNAISAYFDYYHIAARLSTEAERKLSHPLILRFFCEAYGDPASPTPILLNEISDVRLKVLFDEYLRRKLDSICHTSPQRFRTPRAVQEFLFRLADRMRTARRRDIARIELSAVTGEHSIESQDSLYVSVLGEDILLEEEPDAKTGDIQVVFTYDEFMEYMIARSMLRQVTSKDLEWVDHIVKDCQSGMEEFRSLLGVLEYVAVLMREEFDAPIWDRIDVRRVELGGAVCRAIGKLGAEFVGSDEINALEAIMLSDAQSLRLQSVQQLRWIASGTAFDKASRSLAIHALLRVLRTDKDIVVRSEAVKCFESDDTTSVCAEASKFASWLETQKKRARSVGVLFSDDERVFLEGCRKFFSRRGWKQIYLGEDAQETLRLVEQVHPGLVVTDMIKPGMSGAELAAVLKGDSTTSGIPILLVSAWTREETNDGRLFCGVLEKPVEPKDLLRAVEMAIVGTYTG